MDWNLKIGRPCGTNGTYSHHKYLFKLRNRFYGVRKRKTPLVTIGNWQPFVEGKWFTLDGWMPQDYVDRPEEVVCTLLNHEHMHHVLYKLGGASLTHALDRACQRVQNDDKQTGIPCVDDARYG